ncbi:MAG: SusF/SusE family outer membrane protein [Bacteroidales bacterium]|nr:SusF/SusE family outer membrane protein [Bacteroidales bacterium]MDD3664811.1 SusF/SusE family outer membrane protein [Bacteroidales bacterium]
MKKLSILGLLLLSLFAMVIVPSCTKENEDVRVAPAMTTSQVIDITSESATVIGFVVNPGEGVTEKGVCYDIAANPTISKTVVKYTGTATTATFNVTLTGLNYTTTYYARAYVKNSAGVLYGEEYSFTTLVATPTVTAAAFTEVGSSSAKSGGNVADWGGAEVTARGLCYSYYGIPTVDSMKTVDGNGTGAFESALTNLVGGKVYHVRAYATNSAGTGYSEPVDLTTLAAVKPSVTTSAVTNVLGMSATGGGNVTDQGGADVIRRGVCYSTSPIPTLNDSVVESGAGLGEYQAEMTGLTGLTTYYVRAFAENSVGVSYGEEVQFTTLIPIRTWYVPGNYVAASYPGTTFTDWSPANSPFIASLASDPDKLEGYVYMSTFANEWKLTTQPDWNGTNYGDGGAGLLSTTGGNLIAGAGFYKINVNAATLEYTAVATNWGVIGSATPLNWDDETPLEYDMFSRAWKGGMHLTAAEFKFRANHDWGLNYGSTAGNETLDAGGANIPVATEDDYFFTLDLSNPNAYTYTANRWGVIGSATPGGWDSDQNMTWDATNKVMTLTVDLVAGEIKFRANDDWAINLGGSNGTLEYNGPNIAIAEDGNYTITLNMMGSVFTYTVVKN